MPTARVYLIENQGKGYVGSTILQRGLPRRLTYHRQSKRKYEQGKARYMTSFELLDGNETIRLLEEFEYTTREVLMEREQHYINTLPNLVNRINAFGRKDRSEYLTEYREVHKKEIKTYHQERWRRNKMFVEFLRDFNL
ncbi:MAG: hypothetical protein EBU08_11840 [Micrococcales bacterium]|nr:hypothetical protein [Micrococcales bacterium]